MELTVFAKRRQTREGKKFYNYLATLTNRTTGERITCRVRFADSDTALKPEACPCNIILDKGNMQTKEVIREDTGEPMTVYTLWVSEYRLSDIPYVDHSLDDFE